MSLKALEANPPSCFASLPKATAAIIKPGPPIKDPNPFIKLLPMSVPSPERAPPSLNASVMALTPERMLFIAGPNKSAPKAEPA